MKPGQRRAQPIRPVAWALVVLALVLGGQWAGWAHTALETHLACPEHPGEHVHGETRAPETGAADSGPVFAPADEQGRAGHEHCGVLAGLRPVVPAAGGLVDSPALERGYLAAVAREARVVTASERLYLLAPKASPPVAG